MFRLLHKFRRIAAPKIIFIINLFGDIDANSIYYQLG